MEKFEAFLFIKFQRFKGFKKYKHKYNRKINGKGENKKLVEFGILLYYSHEFCFSLF